MQPVNIHEVTERVRALVDAETSAGIDVSRDYDPSIPNLTADPELLIQAMLNIARNAVHALGDAGRIVLRTRVQRRVNIGATQHRLVCRIDVSDNGPGVPDELVDSIFYPLVSGHDAGAGAGAFDCAVTRLRARRDRRVRQPSGRHDIQHFAPDGFRRVRHEAVSGSGEVWVIDDDRSIRWVLERALGRAGFAVVGFDGGTGVQARLRQREPDAIISDIRMPDVDGLVLLGEITARYPHLPVVVMTAYSDLDSAVSAYRGGAYEYLPKPFDIDEAVALITRAVAHNRHNPVHDSGEATASAPGIIGSAPAMQEVFRAIGRLSRSNLTVLIAGESGSGKELVARALHRHSPRSAGTFIALNTAAIPRELLESELFGHERGAFTGAQARRLGRFEQADGGTLFLDEIGDMPADLQTRLLRVLSDGEFYRVGGHMPVRVDVRIIAATHQDLEARVRAGTFREDLFHRLDVIRVHSPALRERREDIPLLLAHFLEQAAREIGVEPKTLKPDVIRYLETLDWPGNVRQLENTCRWLTVMASRERNSCRRSSAGAAPRRRRGPRPGGRMGSIVAPLGGAPTGVGGRRIARRRAAEVRVDPHQVRARANRRSSAGSGQAARLGPQHPDAKDQGACAGCLSGEIATATRCERGGTSRSTPTGGRG